MSFKRKIIQITALLLIISPLFIWGAQTDLDFTTGAELPSEQQKALMKKYELTNCTHATKLINPPKSFTELNETWTGRAALQSIERTDPFICTVPEQGEEMWSKTRALYFEDQNILALSIDDRINLVHEGIHTLQMTPRHYAIANKKTAAYQTVIARELGGLCFSVFDAYQKNLGVRSDVWEDNKERTLAEFLILRLIEEIADEDPERNRWARKPNIKPPAYIMDELMFRSLQDEFILSTYETYFYAKERTSIAWGENLDFTPLSAEQLSKALAGNIYHRDELPRTIDFLNGIGYEANSKRWFAERMEQDFELRSKIERERKGENIKDNVQTESMPY